MCYFKRCPVSGLGVTSKSSSLKISCSCLESSWAQSRCKNITHSSCVGYLYIGGLEKKQLMWHMGGTNLNLVCKVLLKNKTSLNNIPNLHTIPTHPN